MRSSDWVYAIALLCATVPLAVASGLQFAATWIPSLALYTIRASAPMLLAAFVLHACVLVAASQPLAQPTPMWGETVDSNDLLEVVPVSRDERFFGEALGITSTLLSVHVAVLPLLLFQAAVSPISTKAVVAIEVVTVATIIFFGVFAASLGRDARAGWSKARGPVATGVIALLLIVALALTTRLAAFRDAAATLMSQASPGAWRELVATIHNPMLLMILVFAIFTGAIVYFYRHAVRPAEGEIR